MGDLIPILNLDFCDFETVQVIRELKRWMSVETKTEDTIQEKKIKKKSAVSQWFGW